MIRLISLIVALIPVIILAKPMEKFGEEVFLGHEKEFDSSLEQVGQGVDSGPSDIGHELHAKIEEAAEKALALITHAGKYLDDAAHQQESEKDSMKMKDGKDSMRAKREVFPVPQTDSDAAKASSETQKRLFKRQALEVYDYESELEGLNAERVEGEKKKSEKEETDTKDEEEKEEEVPEDDKEDPDEGGDKEEPEDEKKDEGDKDEPEDEEEKPEEGDEDDDKPDEEEEPEDEAEEEPKEDTTDKPEKKHKGHAKNAGLLGDSPPEESEGHSTTGVPGSVATEATDGDKNAGPQEGKDLTSNSWWDAVHGITPEKLDHLITAINEMNELFAGLIERYDAANGAPMTPEDN